MATTFTNSRSLRSQFRVVLCGSMSVYPEILEEQWMLQEREVRTVVPAPEDSVVSELDGKAFETFKRRVAREHLIKIRDPRTVAILAVNCDRYQIRDYIGPNTFAEIAVAFVQGKRIYLLQGIPEMYADELRAWGVIPLHGCVDSLVDVYYEYCARAEQQPRQLKLFD